MLVEQEGGRVPDSRLACTVLSPWLELKRAQTCTGAANSVLCDEFVDKRQCSPETPLSNSEEGRRCLKDQLQILMFS